MISTLLDSMIKLFLFVIRSILEATLDHRRQLERFSWITISLNWFSDNSKSDATHLSWYVEIFYIRDIDFMGPFRPSFGFVYILLVVDYVSKWIEAKSTRTYNTKVVVDFLKINIIRPDRQPDLGTYITNKLVCLSLTRRQDYSSEFSSWSSGWQTQRGHHRHRPPRRDRAWWIYVDHRQSKT